MHNAYNFKSAPKPSLWLLLPPLSHQLLAKVQILVPSDFLKGFLVYRSLRKEAQDVFRRNRFVVTRSNERDIIAEGTPERLGASISLKGVVSPNTLSFPTFLEFVFPSLDKDCLRADEPAY